MAKQANNIQFKLNSALKLFQEYQRYEKDEYEPWTTQEIAEELGCTRRTALTKLGELEERREIKSKSVGKGGGGHIWWRPAEARSSGAPVDPAVLDARVEELELPGTGEELRNRREAVKDAYRYLQKVQVARAMEIAKEVYGSNRGGYASSTTLWRNCLRPGLEQLGLQTPKRGNPWRIVNEDPTVQQADLEDYE